MRHKKRIAYITGTRADFGLMTPVLKAVARSTKLSLRVYATGMHLMPKFGSTLRLVRKEFPSAEIIPAVFKGNTEASTAKFCADVLAGAAKAFMNDRPDFVLLLGDRPEMLATAVACLYLGIPTGHIHGGEKTATADELARHAITKLSSFHFPATADAAGRIKSMGEDLWRIRIVGAPSLDTILRKRLPSKKAVSAFIGFPVSKQFALLVQHPSGRPDTAKREIKETIAALKGLALPVVALYPNADAGSFEMIEALERERRNPLFRIFRNIPYDMFLGVEREAGVFVGNSSAAIIESASFKTPVVNIGERQRGRLRGRNVIDVPANRMNIAEAIRKSLYDVQYRKAIQTTTNPWGDGRTGERVRKILESLTLDEKLLCKQTAY